jgi:hypothetical protein
MKRIILIRMRSVVLALFYAAWVARAFRCLSNKREICRNTNSDIQRLLQRSFAESDNKDDISHDDDISRSRRSLLASAVATITGAALLLSTTEPSQAAVGTLPEFQDTNAILQGLTVQVADESQQDAMIAFLQQGFDFKVLRTRTKGSVTDTWLGYGPEQPSIPSGFRIPVSSFNEYGGHASVHIVYDSSFDRLLYRVGDDAPGDNIAYLQIAVPGYRISKIQANGGTIVNAYGLVEAISPCGLPVRGIVGFVPDPIMFIAINCANVPASKAYYESLGFVEHQVPYARPSRGTTLFEPAPPAKAVYMAPSANCMGVLLLPTKNKKVPTANPVLQSLNVIYSSDGNDIFDGDNGLLIDPSGVPISRQSASEFEAQEKGTR